MKIKRYIPADSRAAVDEVLPAGRLTVLGMQHVMVMYAGAVAVPLIIGMALKLPKEQVAYLISVDLFVSGLITLVQAVGTRWFGVRLPIMMGVSFTGVGPMIAIGANPELGLLGIYGSMICSGLLGIAIAPLMAKGLRFFPPVVIGTEILVVGLCLMVVSAEWAAGGTGHPEFGSPKLIGMSFLVLAFILALTKYFNGFIRNIAVLLGIVFGMGVATVNGSIDFSPVGEAAWFGLVLPFHFGMPKFDFWAIVAMSIVMLVTFIEATGMFVAVGEIVGKPVDEAAMVKGFRADGLGTLLGAVFNIFPYTSYAENVGLVSITGVRSRWVCAMGGVILMALGLFPKMSALVALVPAYVLGGAGLIMFGMITACGVRMLAAVDYDNNPFNAYIIAISVSIGMLPVVKPEFFAKFPAQLAPLLHSSILLAALAAVLLNLFFNVLGGSRQEQLAASLPEGSR
ncbi:nucleobase:cation symporter-2 family protein [Cupriavidus alkaliphilus]|uniref:nucleobase:cation symporter-2 family protein n=1 Tax=Cupriavidus alkaliphilus TaxID=942866 RepID=UPI0008154C77|nr:nucleobase:cation symporter-2 family protein [Cupriavidus alkaliphilus]SCB34811.1 nucleobase:cation symporter-2, NCS2 family [Cupriavidus alkaliphilus]